MQGALNVLKMQLAQAGKKKGLGRRRLDQGGKDDDDGGGFGKAVLGGLAGYGAYKGYKSWQGRSAAKTAARTTATTTAKIAAKTTAETAAKTTAKATAQLPIVGVINRASSRIRRICLINSLLIQHPFEQMTQRMIDTHFDLVLGVSHL